FNPVGAGPRGAGWALAAPQSVGVDPDVGRNVLPTRGPVLVDNHHISKEAAGSCSGQSGSTVRNVPYRPRCEQLTELIEVAAVDRIGIGEDEVPDLVACITHGDTPRKSCGGPPAPPTHSVRPLAMRPGATTHRHDYRALRTPTRSRPRARKTYS